MSGQSEVFSVDPTPFRTGSTVQVGDSLTLSDEPLGAVIDVKRWPGAMGGHHAVVTFDSGRVVRMRPGHMLPIAGAR